MQCLGFTYLTHPCRHTRTTHNMQLPLHTHTIHALSHGNIPHTCIKTFPHTKLTHLTLTYLSKSHQRSFCYHLIAAKHSPHSLYLHSYPYPCQYLSMCLRTHTHTQICHAYALHTYTLYLFPRDQNSTVKKFPGVKHSSCLQSLKIYYLKLKNVMGK